MVQAVHSTPSPQFPAMGNLNNSTGHPEGLSRLRGRACINWEKVLVFANTALIITGVAVAFFMKVPLLMMGLGAYGIFYLIMSMRAQQSRVSEKAIENEDLLRKEGILGNRIEAKKKELKLLKADVSRLRARDEQLSGRVADHRLSAVGKAVEEYLEEELRKFPTDHNGHYQLRGTRGKMLIEIQQRILGVEE